MVKTLLGILKKFFKREDGSDVVTFVLITPLFIFIFALMISFSQILYAGSVALNAANAGCRQAIIQTSESSGNSAANSAVTTYVNDSGMGVKLKSCDTSADGSWSRGNICYCTVIVTVKTVIPMNTVYGKLDSNYVITKVCPMMIERK